MFLLIFFKNKVTMSPTILLIIALFSAVMHLKSVYLGPHQHVYFFKPLTTICILLIALLNVTNTPDARFYKLMILAGLFFSLWGDVFLMLPSNRFIHGLVSFLIAHMFYITAFSSNITKFMSPLFIFPYILFGIAIFKFLSPGLGKLKIPVIIYLIIILAMVVMATNRVVILGDLSSILAFTGAFLFMISDTTLAINKFKVSFKSAEFIILSTYYIAQVLIALSIAKIINV